MKTALHADAELRPPLFALLAYRCPSEFQAELRTAAVNDGAAEALWILSESSDDQVKRGELRIEALKAALAMPNGTGAPVFRKLVNSAVEWEDRRAFRRVGVAMPKGAGANLLCKLLESEADEEERPGLFSETLTAVLERPIGTRGDWLGLLAEKASNETERGAVEWAATTQSNGEGAEALSVLMRLAPNEGEERGRLCEEAVRACLAVPDGERGDKRLSEVAELAMSAAERSAVLHGAVANA